MILIKRDVFPDLKTPGVITGNSQGDRHGPSHAVGKTHAGDHFAIIGFAHESLERRVSTGGNQQQIGNLSPIQLESWNSRHRSHELIAVTSFYFAIHEHAGMWLYE